MEKDHMHYQHCRPFDEFIKVNQLAEAYVPIQIYCGLYNDEEALEKGTVFPALYRAYEKHHRAARCMEEYDGEEYDTIQKLDIKEWLSDGE